MNKPCHDIATAKHIPMYFRLRNHHFENDPGNSICTEDAATTKYMNGTAKRTEKPIIDFQRELQRSASSYTMTAFHGSIFWHVKFLENKDP